MLLPYPKHRLLRYQSRHCGCIAKSELKSILRHQFFIFIRAAHRLVGIVRTFILCASIGAFAVISYIGALELCTEAAWLPS